MCRFYKLVEVFKDLFILFQYRSFISYTSVTDETYCRLVSSVIQADDIARICQNEIQNILKTE